MKSHNSVLQRITDTNISHLLLIAFLISTALVPRICHMSGIIDDPHAWRQCDTDNYARSFYEDGMDLLKPSVCWMGSYKTVILEFPFPELLMAIGYKIFGYDIRIARIITICFFAGSSLYLYYIVRALQNRRIALITSAIYNIVPLSIFYSRAVHIDYFAVFFAHAMTYHYIRYILPGSNIPSIHLIIGTLAGCMAFLIKAPYVFFLALPIFVLGIQIKNIMKNIHITIGFAISVAAFLLWRYHAAVIEAAAPDWNFIYGSDNSNWFFGALEMRLDPNIWKTLAARFYNEVATPLGVVLFISGEIASLTIIIRTGRKEEIFFWIWQFGILCYVMVFLNLNYIHNYYQIPLIAIVSFFIAKSINCVIDTNWIGFGKLAPIIAFSIYIFIFVMSILYSERSYYLLDVVRLECGHIINQKIDKDKLVIVASELINSTHSDPRILYYSHHNGWHISSSNLSPDIISKLKEYGASYLALLTYGNDVNQVCGYDGVSYPLGLHPWTVFIAPL